MLVYYRGGKISDNLRKQEREVLERSDLQSETVINGYKFKLIVNRSLDGGYIYDCIEGWKQCEECEGKARVICDKCDGAGENDCDFCEGQGGFDEKTEAPKHFKKELIKINPNQLSMF